MNGVMNSEQTVIDLSGAIKIKIDNEGSIVLWIVREGKFGKFLSRVLGTFYSILLDHKLISQINDQHLIYKLHSGR